MVQARRVALNPKALVNGLKEEGQPAEAHRSARQAMGPGTGLPEPDFLLFAAILGGADSTHGTGGCNHACRPFVKGQMMTVVAHPPWSVEMGNECPETSVSRVFHVQRTLAYMDGPSHGPRAIAKAAGMNKSTVHRILQAGTEYDAFHRTADGKYRLGAGAITLGVHATVYQFHEKPQRKILSQLLESSGAHVCTIDSLTWLTGARRRTEQLVARDTALAALGMSRADFLEMSYSLRRGAAGRAILAGLPRSVQRAVAEEPIPANAAPGVIRAPGDFLASLDEVRRNGFAVARQEFLAGWDAVAAPVGWGAVMGAVMVAKPTTEMSPDASMEIAHAVAAAARLNRLIVGSSFAPWHSRKAQ